MGLVVMPAAVIAAVLAPFGAAAPALWAMEQGTAWILWVAHTVAAWPGAVTLLPTPGGHVVPLLTAGGLVLVLMRGPPAGGLPVLAALALWTVPGRPPVLISADGGLVGVMGPQGRALSADGCAGLSPGSGWKTTATVRRRTRPRNARACRGSRISGVCGRGARGRASARQGGRAAKVAQACARPASSFWRPRLARMSAGLHGHRPAVLARTGPLALGPTGRMAGRGDTA
jgi:competence protein ComEC